MDQSIHFDGDWTPSEQHIVARAVEDAETLLAMEGGSHGLGKPWICYCKRLPGISVYVAHRAGWLQVLHAYGANELGMKIVLFGHEAEAASRYQA